MPPGPGSSAQQPPLEVLAGGRDGPRRPVPRWVKALGLLTAVAAAAVVLPRVVDDVSARPGPPPGDARLAVVGDALQVTLSGILVVPVELSSPGTALTIRAAEVTAAPVRSAPVVTTPRSVAQGDTRRLAAIVDPDCTVIGPGIGGELVATLVVDVVAPDGQEAALQLALGSDPALQQRLVGLCGGGSAPDLVTAAEESGELGLAVRRDLAGATGG